MKFYRILLGIKTLENVTEQIELMKAQIINYL